MTTKRETSLAALASVMLNTFGAYGQGSGTFCRDPEKPPTALDNGNIIMQDGDPGEPTVTLSPVQYQWDHAVYFEVSASGEVRNGIVDGLLSRMDAAVSADRTLGGVVIDARVMDGPVISEVPSDGTETIRVASVHVRLFYVSDSPIG